MIIKQLVHVDGPKKVPMIKQIVVHLEKALDVTQLAGRPFTVLQISSTGEAMKRKME